MNLGRRDKESFPAKYQAYRLCRTHGRVYGIPLDIDPDEDALPLPLLEHPATLSAASLDELKQQIDAVDPATTTPTVVGSSPGYDLVRHRGIYHAVPQGATLYDLDAAEDRQRAGVLTANSLEQLHDLLEVARTATPVEFAGWLPVYEGFGNCGRHPQFRHIKQWPAGYRFTCSAPPERRHRPSRLGKALRLGWHLLAKVGRGLRAAARTAISFVRPRRGVTLRARWRVLVALLGLAARLVARGCKVPTILGFLQTRNLQSQLLLGDGDGPVFLTSIPFTYGHRPWIIEIEDPTTLFLPHIHNGHTSNVDIAATSCYPIVKTLLEMDSCKAILTHMRSTAQLLGTLFASETIRRKIIHAPLGVALPARWQRHEPQPAGEPIHLLFTNSWHQLPASFYCRGGLDVLEAFAILHERYPQLRLTLRTALPPLDRHYHRILESGAVRVIDRFLADEEMTELHAGSHLYLLPAARIHVVSLLQAMSYGLAVVGSDGWGMDEYLHHEVNGLIVPGRHGKTSWADEQAGQLREDYEPTYLPDAQVVEGLVEAVSRLVEDPGLRRRLGRAARRDVETTFSLENWNRGLRQALDRARPMQPDDRIEQRQDIPLPEPTTRSIACHK